LSGKSTSPEPPAPLEVHLEWEGGHRFRARAGDVEVMLDSPPRAGPTPVQALAFGLAGCMAIDLAAILQRDRLDLRGLRAHLAATRAAEDPKRLLAVDLRFTVEGDVPPDRVDRAIRLSRERYCSVWHSLRPDIELTTSYVVEPGGRVTRRPEPSPSAGDGAA
jgi:putative redox protein